MTNLLPNDTQIVLNLPMEHLLGNAKFNKALLKTPGAFHEASFSVPGASLRRCRRVVLAYNVEQEDRFLGDADVRCR